MARRAAKRVTATTDTPPVEAAGVSRDGVGPVVVEFRPAEATPEPATPPSARVEITTGEHQVVVEANESLTTVADTALQMWKATDVPTPLRAGTTIGFCPDVEPGDGQVLPLSVPLPDRMLPGEDDE